MPTSWRKKSVKALPLMTNGQDPGPTQMGLNWGNTHVASVKLQGKEPEGEDWHDEEVDSVLRWADNLSVQSLFPQSPWGVGEHSTGQHDLPPHQRLLLSFGPCYFLGVAVVAPTELTLSQGGNLLFVRHCCREGGLCFFNRSRLPPNFRCRLFGRESRSGQGLRGWQVSGQREWNIYLVYPSYLLDFRGTLLSNSKGLLNPAPAMRQPNLLWPRGGFSTSGTYASRPNYTQKRHAPWVVGGVCPPPLCGS